MEGNTELLRLEEIVDQLLTKYGQLKSDYRQLEEMLQERDTECAELKAKLDSLNTEQTAVSNRVSGLLDRIAQWETEQDRESDSSNTSYGYEGNTAPEADTAQGSLFNGE